MTTTPTKKKAGKAKDIETFPPPPIDIELKPEIVFNAALNNDFQTICGAYDCKEHPLASYITKENLFIQRNEYSKTPFDLASCVGSYEFLKTLLERMEKLTPEVLDFKKTNTNGYTCLHHACIWGRADICKLLVFNTGLAGVFLLKSKTVNNETPKHLAIRYNHPNVVEFLNFAELRQSLIDKINNIRETADDPEKHQGKFNKDDKKKIEKLHKELSEWLEKSKEESNLEEINAKSLEIDELLKPFLDKLNSVSTSKPSSATIKK